MQVAQCQTRYKDTVGSHLEIVSAKPMRALYRGSAVRLGTAQRRAKWLTGYYWIQQKHR